jgi:hypothetical protein
MSEPMPFLIPDRFPGWWFKLYSTRLPGPVVYTPIMAAMVVQLEDKALTCLHASNGSDHVILVTDCWNEAANEAMEEMLSACEKEK